MAQRTLVVTPAEDIQKCFYGLQEGEDGQKALSPFTNFESINTLSFKYSSCSLAQAK